ncbi:MAG: tetratricopeptide repeat protein [Chitinophagales bacterium]|nr:tetratricopeptide repeat protein [Bacteroidota bacterium]MCB9042479.1 tetratricopeptide repeat protein [Chitinophagales bacterium]
MEIAMKEMQAGAEQMKGNKANSSSSATITVPKEQLTQHIDALQNQLPDSQKDSIRQLENTLSKTPKDPKTLANLSELWEKYQAPTAAAYYANQLANLDTSQLENLKKAGDLSYQAFHLTKDSMLFAYYVDNSYHFFEKLTQLEPENLDNRINFAATLIEGRNEVMPGIFALREVVQQEPNNIRANFLLGRLAIVSGQNDKAIERLRLVTSIDSLNSEAWYYLGDAYARMGEKDKSLAAFARCRKLINDPAFDAELDKYIQQIFQ